jgi:hypothetical protein
MVNQNQALSVCPSRETLEGRETALREAGFGVVSVLTDTQARFEIEMGQCGVLLMSVDVFQVISRTGTGIVAAIQGILP